MYKACLWKQNNTRKDEGWKEDDERMMFAELIQSALLDCMATSWSHGEILCDDLIANLLPTRTMKEFWESISICQCYDP